MADGPFAHVAGRRFPGGTTIVPDWMNRLWGEAVCAASDPTPYVHPILVYSAAVQGAGVSLEEIFEMFEGSVDSGIMLGEQTLDFRRPIEVGHEYVVDGLITDVVRKAGRRAGPFDVATFELRLLDANTADPIAISRTSFVFPRREREP